MLNAHQHGYRPIHAGENTDYMERLKMYLGFVCTQFSPEDKLLSVKRF